MRAVLYTDDFEPITVLELSQQACGYLERTGIVNLAVIPPVQLHWEESGEITGNSIRQVCIRAELFVYRRKRTLLLFTSDDENALLLKSAFLPGQIAQVRENERSAFARGFLTAIAGLGEG